MMGAKLRSLPPSEAFQDAMRRSFAAGVAGAVLVGMLHTGGAFSAPYTAVSVIEAVFFGSLTLLVGYYHRRWEIGLGGAVLSMFLPYVANLVYVKFSSHSLIFPTVVIVLLGGIAVELAHRKISGPQADYDAEEEAMRIFIEETDSSLTWVDRVTWLCFMAATVLLVILLAR
jgi:hypothetical protein